MDAHGIDLQVLSCLTTQLLPAEQALGLTRAANDRLAAACERHPDRFAAFASVPTSDPARAAGELQRAVEELGHVGALIHGRTNDEFLSVDRYGPVLSTAASLGVPIYLHPAPPTRATSEANYEAGRSRGGRAFGDCGVGMAQRDRRPLPESGAQRRVRPAPDAAAHPGPLGEMVPWFLDRLDEALPQRATGLDRTIGEYFRENVYYTPSGMFSTAHLRFCVDQLGTDRMMFSVDYPFVGNDAARSFLQDSDLSEEARSAVAHGNAERLLGI